MEDGKGMYVGTVDVGVQIGVVLAGGVEGVVDGALLLLRQLVRREDVLLWVSASYGGHDADRSRARDFLHFAVHRVAVCKKRGA